LASTIPTHSSGDVLPAADWNTLVPLNTQSGIYGATAALIGTTPAVSAPSFLIQAGFNVTTTNVSGIATISFPSVFPNGVLTVVACGGDNNSGTQPGIEVCVLLSSLATTSFEVQVFHQGSSSTYSGYVSGTVNINWIAVGF